MRHDDRLRAVSSSGDGPDRGILDRCGHPLNLFPIRLSPRGPQRIQQFRPVSGVPYQFGLVDVQALEIISGFDDPFLWMDRQTELLRDRARRLLRPSQRRRRQVNDLGTVLGPARKFASRQFCHGPAGFGQMEFREATIDDAVRVVNFTVPQ